MNFLQPRKMPIHAVFARHLRALWKVVDFLVLRQALVKHTFDVRACPTNCPFLIPLGYFSETVVFKSISYQRYIDTVIEFEVISFVLGLVWTDTHRVDVRPKDQKFLA